MEGGRAGAPSAPPPVTERLVALVSARLDGHLQPTELEGSGGGRPRRLLHADQRGVLGLLRETVRVRGVAAVDAGTLAGVLGCHTDVDVRERRVGAQVIEVD